LIFWVNICIKAYSLQKNFFRDFIYSDFQRKAVPPVAKTELEMGFEILFVCEALEVCLFKV
jgi:hypothetical protein